MSSDNTDLLLRRAATGNDSAVQRLFQRHRTRLQRMVTVRMDRRLTGRIDPSDVVQETLITASDRLNTYLQAKPIGFYPWLRQIAWDKLLDLKRYHVVAQRRSVTSEVAIEELELSDQSHAALAENFIDKQLGPTYQLAKEELHRRVRSAMDNLSPSDRELIVMRFVEHLTVAEASDVMGISADAIKTRQVRALARMRKLLKKLKWELS